MPKVDFQSGAALLKRLAAPSFPKAIALAAVLCGSILWKYRTPIAVTAHASKVRPALVKKAAVPKKVAAPVAGERPVQMNPAPAMGNPPPKAPQVAQKPAAKKSRKKVVATSKAMKRFFLAAAKMEPDFDWPEVDESLLAVNVTSPLEEIAEEKLSQDLEEDSGLSVNLVSLKPAAPEKAVADNRLQIVIGEIVQNDFQDIKSDLAAQKEAFAEITPIVVQVEEPKNQIVRPEPTLVKAKAVAKKKVAPTKKAVALTKAEPTLVLPKASAAPLPVEAKSAPKNPAALNAYFAKMGSLGGIVDEISSSSAISAPVTTQPTLVSPAVSSIQPVPEQRVATGEKNVLVIPSGNRPAAPSGQVHVVPPKEDRKAIDPRRTRIDERLQGRLELTDKVIDYVEMKDAYIELSLAPAGNLSSQGILPVEYHFPEENFWSEPTYRTGEFWLQANFYSSKGADALTLPIRYKDKISAANQNQFIHFEINEQMLESAIQGMHAAPSNGIWFTSIFYKVDPGKDKPDATAKKQRENRVTSGEVSFVGFPKWGTYKIAADGTVRAPLPARSEVMVKVTSPGFYPTYQIVPTFSSAINSYIYLTHETEMDPIVGYFTGSLQQKLNLLSPGLIFLRMFDPTTIEPLAQVPYDISHPNSARQLLPATTETGFGGFANVVPSMRVIGRDKGQPKWLVNVPEGSSQYIEFGRSGRRTLVGKLSSIEGQPVGPARVRLVGDKASETWSDDVGNFRMENLDFPPGLVSLEVEAPKYGLSWFNVSYDPSQPERPRKIYVDSQDNEKEDRVAHSEIPTANPHLGVLKGALSPNFFHGENCVYLHLRDIANQEVTLEKGPYPLGAARRDENNPYCLPSVPNEKSTYEYINLRDGEYIFSVETASGRVLRTHVLRVGARGIRTLTVD